MSFDDFMKKAQQGAHGEEQGIRPGPLPTVNGGGYTPPPRAIIPPTESGTRPEIVEFPESWPGVTFTEAGLVFSENLTGDVWIKLGAWLGSFNRKTRLWIGDWINEGVRRDQSYDVMEEITGLKRETLYNYASIARRVPLRNRIAGASTGLYEAVASLDSNEQISVLKQAIHNDWDRDRTRDAVDQMHQTGQASEEPPFREEMTEMANLTPALGFEEKTGDVRVYVLAVPDSLSWADDHYGALREILPDDVRAGDVWEIVARKRE